MEGGEIPYKPAALDQKKKNQANRWKDDPEVKCYMPGVPRAAYLPYPFQIIQSQKDILFAYEYATTNRLINMGKPKEAATDTWMGTSNGHWEKDTLVVDVTGFNGLAWFDRAGDFASDSLHVVERYTLVDANTINYEATIEDPATFTQAVEDQPGFVPASGKRRAAAGVQVRGVCRAVALRRFGSQEAASKRVTW